jgi:hypothetical protein
MAMIGTTWMKWTAGAAAVAVLAALPAMTQAHVRYTGRTPASVTPVAHVQTVKKSAKLASHKRKLHAKKHASKKLHAGRKLRHHTLSTSKSKKA